MTTTQILGAAGIAVMAVVGVWFMANTIGWRDALKAVLFSLSLAAAIVFLTGLMVGAIG